MKFQSKRLPSNSMSLHYVFVVQIHVEYSVYSSFPQSFSPATKLSCTSKFTFLRYFSAYGHKIYLSQLQTIRHYLFSHFYVSYLSLTLKIQSVSYFVSLNCNDDYKPLNEALPLFYLRKSWSRDYTVTSPNLIGLLVRRKTISLNFISTKTTMKKE